MFSWFRPRAERVYDLAQQQNAGRLRFDYSVLNAQALAGAAAHLARNPYPHTCVDNILPETFAQTLARSVPQPKGEPHWNRYFAAGFEDKWSISDDQVLPISFQSLVREMNSAAFLSYLETLTGIDHLLPDPHLHGAGLHLVPNGGVLEVHADFNVSERLQAHRRVNVFIYLNPRWEEHWGGALELWDEPHGRCQARFWPKFNRMVVFNSRSDTFHGHPHPINCPTGEWRTSIAMYYYTSHRPETEMKPSHNTVYKGMHV